MSPRAPGSARRSRSSTLGGTSSWLPPAAFVGGSVAVVAAYAIGRSTGRGSGGATLVLAGVTVASFFTAVQTFVQQQHSDTLQQVYSWILGSLPSSDWTDVKTLLPYAVIATVGILCTAGSSTCSASATTRLRASA